MRAAKTIRPTGAAYPGNIQDALKNLPQLDAIGETSLLGSPAIGICGSRDASPEALEYAYEFGRRCAKQDFVVVSGHARGVDRQAEKGALEAGGKAIAVLPEGIDGFRIVRELQPFVDLEKNFLAVSMFESGASWTTWRAMDRNKLIVALSIGLFVIEAREKGGTINAAFECNRQRKPLWAIKYQVENEDRAGNTELLRQEMALPLETRADLSAALEMATGHSLTVNSQIPLAV